MKPRVLAVFISVLLAVAFYYLVLNAVDYEAVLGSAGRLDLQAWMVVLSLSLLNYWLRMVRWDFYIKKISPCTIPFLKHLEIYIAGFALTTTPGKVGEAVRSVYLKPYGVSYPASFSTLFVERLVDVIAITVLTTSAAFVIPAIRPYAIGTLFFVVATVFSIRKGYIERLLVFLESYVSGRFHDLLKSIGEMIQVASGLLKTRMLYGGLVIGVISWGAEGLGLYLILKYLGVDVSLSLAVSIYAVSVLAGALSFIPGGLGAAEAVMYGLLLLQGVPEVEAAAATLICRIATLWFAVVLGIVPLARLLAGKRGDDLRGFSSER